MKKACFALLAAATVTLGTYRVSNSHCEIPCGVYGDTMRISMLYENITTIEKSMAQIKALSAEASPNWNQLVRWTQNKEQHANEIQHIVTQYFMTQRVKPKNKQYIKQLTTLHKMLLSAMKSKQTIDTAHIAALRQQVKDFAEAYFSAEDLRHISGHHPEGK